MPNSPEEQEGSIPKVPEEGVTDEQQVPKYMKLDNRGRNIEERSNFLSNLFFSFVTPMISHGYKKPLSLDDMWPIGQEDSGDHATQKMEKIWADQKAKKGEQASLFKCIFSFFGFKFFIVALQQAISRGGQLAQPLILEQFLKWYINPEEEDYWGYIWAAVFFAVPFVTAIMDAASDRLATHAMVQIRNAIARMVYEKSLRISSTTKIELGGPKARGGKGKRGKPGKRGEKKRRNKQGEDGGGEGESGNAADGVKSPGAANLDETTTGKIVNLMSVDAEKLALSVRFLPQTIMVPVQAVINIALIYQTMKECTFVGIGTIFVVLPVTITCMIVQVKFNAKQSALADTRLKITNEVLQGFRVVKFYAWEQSFLKTMQDIRAVEAKQIFKTVMAFQGVITAFNILPVLMPVFTFLTFHYTYPGQLNAVVIFRTLAYFQGLQLPLVFVPIVLSQLAVGLVSSRRIQAFLQQPEMQSTCSKPVADPAEPLVVRGSFMYGSPKSKAAEQPGQTGKTEQITVQQEQGGGEGQAGEGQQTDGSEISVLVPSGPDDEVGEAAPFKLDNIEFKARAGQLTAVVGAVGSGKSSLLLTLLGEMQPVSTEEMPEPELQKSGAMAYVAQAAWIRTQSIRENILFGQPFDEKRYWKVIDVCALQADLDALPHGDMTQIGDRGINLSGGQKQRIAIARATYSGLPTYLFDDPLSAVDANVGQHIMQNCLLDALQGKTRVLVMNQLHFLPRCDFIYVLDNGRVVAAGEFEELKKSNDHFRSMVEAHERDLQSEQARASQDDSKLAPDKLSAEASVSISRQSSSQFLQESNKPAVPAVGTDTSLFTEEEINIGRVGFGQYKRHFQRMGMCRTFLFLFMNFPVQACLTGTSFMLSWWTQDKLNKPVTFYLFLYGMLGLAGGVFTLLRGLTFAWGTKAACINYHTTLLNKALHAPCSFFDVTPVGRVLNRFTKDLNDVDTMMPRFLQSTFNILFLVLGALVATAVVTPAFVGVIAVVGVLFMLMQRYYSAAAVQLKRQESVTRSPVYNHFSETILGCSTIRAFGATAAFTAENAANLNVTAQAFFLVRMVLGWAAVRIGMLNAALLFCATLFTALQKHQGTPAGDAAVAIYCILQIGPLFGFLVNNFTELDNVMNSVERLCFYSESIESEPSWDEDKVDVPADWPSKGEISLEGVTFAYRKDLEPVLKCVTAHIGSQETVGVAGRTGSGKSSLMLCLFRMYELREGAIRIDGVDISQVGLHTLRKKLAIIPQDPVIFSGTVAGNLDPFKEHSEAEQWDALHHVNLKAFVEGLGGLKAEITEHGGNLSAGQRQLLCIARAILRKPKILVMDEATSSVDSATDSVIQSAVRTQFTNCTILTIAHRLNTIMDSQRVMVLDKGEVEEFDAPWKLVGETEEERKNKKGLFASMFQAMSHAETK